MKYFLNIPTIKNTQEFYGTPVECFKSKLRHKPIKGSGLHVNSIKFRDKSSFKSMNDFT